MSKLHKWKGIDEIKNIISSFKDRVIVYFDPDVDGMVAGYFVCKYLSSIGKRFQWYVNQNRSHDWSIDVDKIKGKDIIAVDFMIPESKIKEIVGAGCNIISMDHHINQDTFINIKNKGDQGVVINNQYPFEEDDGRYLSGAGVVFETICNINPEFNTLENRALVGLTLLSDVCEIENSLAKGYLSDLYNHKYKGYIKYLIENTMGDKDYGFGVPRLDRRYVDYKFSPAINACLRFNKGDDVVRFFLGSGKLDLSYHKRQKALVKDMVDVAKVIEFPNLRVVYVKDWEVNTLEDKDVMSNFIGLIASRFLDGKKSAVAYIISNDNGEKYVKRASFRGSINGVDYLSASQGIIKGVGHPSAFGIVEIIPNKITFDKLNEASKEAEGKDSNSMNITPTSNLSIFANKKGREYAEHNMYCLSQNSKYIRYIGKNISVKKEGANFIKYKVDGIDVLCFDLNLDFSTGLIYPILERGYIYYYLQGKN